MATLKNTSTDQVDIPLYDLHIAPGDTVELPDDVAAQLQARPEFAKSRTQSPTVSLPAETVGAATGAIPVVAAPDATPSVAPAAPPAVPAN